MADTIETTGNIHVSGSVSTETPASVPHSLLAEIETELALIPHEVIARVEAPFSALKAWFDAPDMGPRDALDIVFEIIASLPKEAFEQIKALAEKLKADL